MRSRGGEPRETRREFLVHTAALAAAACAPALRIPGRAAHDLVLRGGTVFDGAGAPGRVADLAVTGDRIVEIAATIAGRGDEEIDVRGLAVAPGFVDIHSHGDGTMFEDPRSESVVRQGITTIVVGQDGSSRAPAAIDNDAADRVRRVYDADDRFASVAELLGAFDRLPPSVNVATMVGLGTVRRLVVGSENRPATPTEVARMRALVAGALEQGACGVSSGLEYIPGAFATRPELVELCRPLVARGLPYATHLRNEDDQLLESLEEALAIGRGAGCAVQVSHLKTQGPRNWPKIGDALGLLERARRDGLDVAFDRYPYVAYATGLTSLFPPWARAGGVDAFFRRLADDGTAARVRRETLEKVELIGGWTNVMITSMPRGVEPEAPGKRLDELARARGAAGAGADPYELALALVRASGGEAGMVGFAMSEENIERFLAHPLGMVCSDGGAFAVDGPTRRGHPHPRGAGSFPRVLARYVRERRALGLEEAVRKMTSFPASRARLLDRGRLAPGMPADVVVFDPAAVTDRASFEDPFRYPDGIRLVIVNGGIALRDGERSERRNGRALRPAS